MKTRRPTATSHPPPPLPAAVQSPKHCPQLFWRWRWWQWQGWWLWWWWWHWHRRMPHPPQGPPGRPPQHRGEGGFLPPLRRREWEGRGLLPPGGQGWRWQWQGWWHGGGVGVGVSGCCIPRGGLLVGLLGTAGRVISSPLFSKGNGRGGIAPPWGDWVGGGMVVEWRWWWWCRW